MTIKQVRKYFTDTSTISELYKNEINPENFICYAIEDVDRGITQAMSEDEIKKIKVKAETAIPYGKYQVLITMSNRFKKELPILLNVKGFEGIRIHTGNKSTDSEGCILPGIKMGVDVVEGSKIAFDKLFPMIKSELDKKENVYIEITKK